MAKAKAFSQDFSVRLHHGPHSQNTPNAIYGQTSDPASVRTGGPRDDGEGLQYRQINTRWATSRRGEEERHFLGFDRSIQNGVNDFQTAPVVLRTTAMVSEITPATSVATGSKLHRRSQFPAPMVSKRHSRVQNNTNVFTAIPTSSNRHVFRPPTFSKH